MNLSISRARLGLLLVLSAILLVLLLPEVARAQEGAGVSDALVTTIVRSRFPDGIRFDISVSGSRKIVDVRLRYRVLGERATRYGRLDFEPTMQLENEFTVRTDTADRYIPPGVEIEYALEITDEDGLLTETKPQRFILLDPRFQWQRLDSPGGYIYYHGPQRDRALRVLDAAQTALTTMGALMGVTDTGPLRMTMYNGVNEMRVALPTTSAVQEESLITEGVSFGDTGVILVLGSTPRVEGVTSHETVHFLVRHATGNLSRIVPAWLNEGLAEYGNVEPSGSYDRASPERRGIYGRYVRLSIASEAPRRHAVGHGYRRRAHSGLRLRSHGVGGRMACEYRCASIRGHTKPLCPSYCDTTSHPGALRRRHTYS